MTTDEIETAAIEAALRKFSVGILVAMGERPEAANARFEKELHTSDPETAAQLAELRGITVEAVRAYERAMWRPISEAPRDSVFVVTVSCAPEPFSILMGGERQTYIADGDQDDTPPTNFRPLPRREGE